MTDYVPVDLCWLEVMLAGHVSVGRSTSNIRNGRGDRYGMKYDGFSEDEGWLGALAEYGTAKHLNLHWAPFDLGAVDVGGKVQVRGVGNDKHRLLLHPGDEDDLPFVSVLVERVQLPRVYLRGWIMGRDGKRQEWWSEPQAGRGCFCVPNDELRPMAALQEVL
jgi:hypothetical protein